MDSDFTFFFHTLFNHSKDPASTEKYFTAGIGQLLHNQPYLAIANLVHAAINGHPEAPLYIGLIFSSGYCITPHHLIALRWFARAAKHNNALSRFMLGTIFRAGLCVPRDTHSAIVWYTRAAQKGLVDAQMHIGSIFCGGTDLPPDFVNAFAYFSRAAYRNHAEAQLALGLLYEYGLGVEQHSSKAAWWYERASKQGCAEATFRLGYMHILGKGMFSDYNEGIRLLLSASELGHPSAIHFLTTLLHAGIEQEKSKCTMAENFLYRFAHHYYNRAMDILQHYARFPKSAHEILTELLRGYEKLKDTPPQGPLEKKLSELPEKEWEIDPATRLPNCIANIAYGLSKDLEQDILISQNWIDDLEKDTEAPMRYLIEEEYKRLFSDMSTGTEALTERIIEPAIPRHTEEGGDESPCNGAPLFSDQEREALLCPSAKAADDASADHAPEQENPLSADDSCSDEPLIAYKPENAPAAQNQHLLSDEEPTKNIDSVLFKKLMRTPEFQFLLVDGGDPTLENLSHYLKPSVETDSMRRLMSYLPYAPLRNRASIESWAPLYFAPSIEEEAYHREVLSRLRHEQPKLKAAELRELKRAAEKGDAAAQRRLGLLYLSGQGVAYDALQALKWFTFASGQDDPDAIYYQALIHRLGLDTIPDTPRALQLLTRAAELKHLPAQFSLGLLLAYGPDEPDSDTRALRQISQAAEQGYSPAQYMMGSFCVRHRHGSPDYEKAAYWFTHAARQEHPLAQLNLYILYALNHTQNISAEQGLYWLRRAAQNGVAQAQLYLGGSYALGHEVERDLAAAAVWIERAALQENRIAQFLLGLFYRRGYGLPRDHEEACRWIRHAALHTCLDTAQLNDIPYGLTLHENADNLTEAARLFENNAKEGNTDAAFNLASCYLYGWGAPKDEAQAARLFTNAAQGKHSLAMFYLGICYLHGLGVPQSDSQAYQWIRRAAKNDVKQAFFYLALMHFCGWGAPARASQALYYLLRATDSGYTPAARLTDFLLRTRGAYPTLPLFGEGVEGLLCT